MSDTFERVTMVGLAYIGLPAAVMASRGMQVLGLDVNEPGSR